MLAAEVAVPHACAMSLWPFAFLILSLMNRAAWPSSTMEDQANEQGEAISLVLSNAAWAVFVFAYVPHPLLVPQPQFSRCDKSSDAGGIFGALIDRP